MSYVTVTEADTYFLTERLDSDAWTAENATNKTKALAQATRLIDGLNFIGDKKEDTQELEFPRNSDTVVPTDIKIACYEIAFALIIGRNIEMEAELIGQVATLSNSIESRRDPDSVPIHILHGIPSAVAWRHLRPYLRPGDVITLSRVD
jgi:hypothetical protein